MEKIIKAAVDRGASDIHIKAGDVFRARIDGKLVALTKQALTPEQTKAIALRIIANEEDRGRIDRIRDYDCSWGAGGVGRFRVNILRQRSSFMIVMRVIPFEVPTIGHLQLPPRLSEIVDVDRGLVLITGGTSSGKSSTIAALVNHINSSAHKHIVTLEQPIEFLHRDLNCSVTQREVGVDTDSFATGLRAALRQDPDVIVIGEIHDAETLDTALYGVETGHLILSALDAHDVRNTIARIVTMYPASQRRVILHRFGESVRGIVSQRLLPRADEKGRVVAAEVLVGTPEIREAIAEPDRFDDIVRLMETGQEHGMQTFDQHLRALLEAGIISPSIASAASGDPEAFSARAGSRRPKRGGEGSRRGAGAPAA